MSELTKDQLEQALTTVAEGLGAAKRMPKLEYNFYAKLFPDGCSEIHLADAINHVELHPLMVQVVGKIIELISVGKVGSIWIDSENQAGRYLSHALALYDKKYCGLFAQCLSFQDLAHEVHQNEDIDDIMREWGLCDETGLILSAREDNPGQWGPEYLEELREEYGEAVEEYLGVVNLDSDEELGPEEELDWGVGYSVEAQSKDNRFIFLDWDKNGSFLMVRYNLGQWKITQYESPEDLQQAVDAFQAYCKEQNYSWQMETGTASVDQMTENVKTEPPCNLLALFDPNGPCFDK